MTWVCGLLCRKSAVHKHFPGFLLSGYEERLIHSRSLCCLLHRNNDHTFLMRNLGVFSLEDLNSRGLSRRQIERLIAEGKLSRLARGWYATPGADDHVVAALRSGVRLGCLSACRRYGLWVPSGPRMHVVYGDARKPNEIPGALIHHYGARQPKRALWPLEDYLRQVIRHHDIETGLVVVESAINCKAISRDEALNLEGPTKKIAPLRRHLNKAESGSETRVRLFLESHNIPVSPQVHIPNVGRVDLVVGKNMIVECDSFAHHSSKAAMENDRQRDLASLDAGYTRVRLSYVQIWDDWPATQSALLRVIGKRKHLR